MTELSVGATVGELAARLEYVERQLAALWRQTYHGRPYMPFSDAALQISDHRGPSAEVAVDSTL